MIHASIEQPAEADRDKLPGSRKSQWWLELHTARNLAAISPERKT
jgi:hypothetical protein